MQITFPKEHVRQLLEMSKSTEQPTPIFDQLVDPELWRDDIDPSRRQMLDAELKEDGFPISARAEDVDLAKLPRGLIMVGDDGVYLMSQAPIAEVKAANIDHVAYANEINPNTLEAGECYDRKREAFGGDDGTIFLTAEVVEAGLSKGTDLIIDLTPTHYAILSAPVH
jgi:hypothetical protein